MKQIFSIVLILVLCSNEIILAQDVTKTPIVGNDKDKHGCISSAGYTWSVLKKECIRTFELIQNDKNAIELASIDNTQKMVMLFSSDKAKAEVFYSGGNKVVNKSVKGNVYVVKKEKNMIEKLINLKGKWQFVKISNGKREVLYQ